MNSKQAPPITRHQGVSEIDTPLKPDATHYSMDNGRLKVLIFNQRNFESTKPQKVPDTDPEATSKNNNTNKRERHGTEKDVERLIKTLPLLGARQEDMVLYDDYTYSEIERTVYCLKNDDKLKQFDGLIVVILTHGSKHNMVSAKDKSYNLFEFMEHFTPTALNSMAGKPKIFIVQACRGAKVDRGAPLVSIAVDGPTEKVNSKKNRFIHPEYADLMILMSSHYDHISFRDHNHGTWLIQELCNVIERSDLNTTSMYDIFTDTNNAVSKRSILYSDSNNDNLEIKAKQICSVYSTMTKRLYFKGSSATSTEQPTN